MNYPIRNTMASRGSCVPTCAVPPDCLHFFNFSMSIPQGQGFVDSMRAVEHIIKSTSPMHNTFSIGRLFGAMLHDLNLGSYPYAHIAVQAEAASVSFG